MTDMCNLACRHCYADCAANAARTRFDAREAKDFLLLMKKISVPALLLSGGEPLIHPDFWSCLVSAHELGLNVTVSTNGTLIDGPAAELLSENASYVGISVDGPRSVHDEFRGVVGTYDATLSAIGLLVSKRCRVGLRVTLAAPVLKWLGDIFDLADSLPISRICFYHFIPSGRGAEDASLVPGRYDEDSAIHRIIEWADKKTAPDAGHGPLEVLTAGESADNVRVYKYLESKSDKRIEKASALMRRSAEKPGGTGILSVRWDGMVFRNQFMWKNELGHWRDIERIAGLEARNEISAECESCTWARKICGGRVAGFGRECAL
jgi:MoaA/NifB/PqqE/SkfB family radical SAM enzyme